MKVLCSGLNVVDLLVLVPSNIKIGQKNECDRIVLQGGAPAGNAACALASLGHDTSFLGYFGNNLLSSVAIDELTRHGVNVDFFIEKEDATPAIAIVQVDDAGERTVFYSTENYIPFSPKDFNKEDLNGFNLILVDGYDTEINSHLLELANRLGIKSVLDMEASDHDTMKKMIGLCTHAVLPLEAAQKVSGEQDVVKALRAVSELTDAQVVITDGVEGAFALNNKQVIHQPSFKVDVVDTTGCGDSFHAAYASGLLQGFTLEERLYYASYYASQVAEHFGGRTFLPTKDFMDKNCSFKINA